MKKFYRLLFSFFFVKKEWLSDKYIGKKDLIGTIILI